MKTIKLLLIVAATLCITCIGCSKFEDEPDGTAALKAVPATTTNAITHYHYETWLEEFSTPASLDNNWYLLGYYNKPEWVYLAYGKQGLFNNNGPSPYKNYGISKINIGRGKGYTVEGEVMIKIKNYGGSCICPGIAIAKDEKPQVVQNEIPAGISMKIVYAGTNAIWFSKEQREHTWIVMDYITQTGTRASSGFIEGDNYVNSWHKLKLEVTETGYVKFYLDQRLLWTPMNRIHPSLASNKPVILGYTSDGNPNTMAGEAYHNYIKTVYAVPLEVE